ncbi:alpha/beta fold hydrolase [Actinomadura sp. B10D3]|uniref:alpha/beta hydrolase n=1 Tax=Actinomadura sp. B10D3 TaxID=3153557 RepID=UPI00325EB559
MVSAVRFFSDHSVLEGHVYRPKGRVGSTPGIVLCHGFAGQTAPALAAALADLGYTVLTFMFSGYGASGRRGEVDCEQQVRDARTAVSFLASQPGVDADRIGIVGSSLGGSIAILASAEDERIAACVAACPIGDGERMMRARISADDAWRRHTERIRRAREDGRPVHRFDIVFIPEELREHLPMDTPMEFPADTFFSVQSLNAHSAIGKLSPRPLLVLHAVDDDVVPKTESDRLVADAGPSCDYRELEQGNHFILAQPGVHKSVCEWLTVHLPVAA